MAGTGQTSIRSYNFFVDSTIAAGGYATNQHDFIDADDQTPFLSHSILIVNDSSNPITFRFTADSGGGAPHGIVAASEQLQLDFKRARRIYLTGTTADAFRVWAW